ncbi:MAG: hypothetical protein ACFFDQ_09395 [Candidatus Thorarchaeota archaeon]
MSKRCALILLIALIVIAPAVDAKEQNSVLSPQTSSRHDIVIDAYDWESFPIDCYRGDTLSGEFAIVQNGELFPGDQTEYDFWLLDGIDFFVFDKENYSLWVENSLASSLLERWDLSELIWSVEIPYDDEWHVVYSNDSIYMKEIKGNIIRSGQFDEFSLIIVLVGLAALLSLTLIIWKKK